MQIQLTAGRTDEKRPFPSNKQVLQGKVYETSRTEFAYTSFSGFLVSPLPAGTRPPLSPPPTRTTPPPPATRKPSYKPPVLPPPFTSRPPYIYTTTTSPTRRPPYIGRADGCCDSLLVTARDRRVRDMQREKLGLYRYHETSGRHGGRAVYKHCENDVYLYYFESPRGWSGWLAGPSVGGRRGGLIQEGDAFCAEDDERTPWQFFDAPEGFTVDDSIEVKCAGPGDEDRYGGHDYGEILRHIFF